MSDEKRKPPLPPEWVTKWGEPYHASVGRIASAWALLELRVDTIIWQMAGIKDRPGACITAQLFGFAPRMKAVIALAKHCGCSKKVIGALEDFNNRSYSVNELRNRAVHDPWAFDSEANLARKIRVTANKDLVLKSIPVSLTDLQEIRKKIQERHRKWGEIEKRIKTELAALQKK